MEPWICPVCKEEIGLGDCVGHHNKCSSVPKRKPNIFDKADPDKVIVSMLEYKGEIIVATERGIYKMVGGALERIKFVEKKDI